MIYYSDAILQMDNLYDIQENFYSFGIPFQYRLTEGELEWLSFVRGRYSIADYIDNNRNGDILTFACPITLSEVIESDGIPHKAVMLSDDTALQRLIFYCS